MNKEELKQLAENPEFIPGIYNYCDRWCERCPFTSRCLNFAMADEQFGDSETQDIHNEAFWRKLSDTFRMTLDLLHEMAEREGIDLDALDTQEAVEEERRNGEIAQNHNCCSAARAYGEMADAVLGSLQDLFEGKEDEFGLDRHLGTIQGSPAEEDPSLEEAVEVIRWYQHQIYVKLMRAVRGSLEEEEEGFAEFAKDSDGSAKVALIGIDRSLAAWGTLRSHFPLLLNDILDVIVHLEQLRREVERLFPDARAFIRPGFDRIDLNS